MIKLKELFGIYNPISMEVPMSRVHVALFALLVGFLSLLAYAQVQSVVTTTTNPSGTVVKREIITTVPTAKETISIPAGYVNCFMVDAGWDKNVWVPKHQVCQYQNMPGKVAWIEGYWACTAYKSNGTCTSWEWKGAHWSSNLEIY